MKAKYLGLIAVLLALSLAIFLWWSNDKQSTESNSKSIATPITAPNNAAANNELPNNIQSELDYAQFQQQTREFFVKAASLNDNDKQHQAEQIEQQANHYQQQGFVSASEALMLKLALLKLTLNDSAFEQQGQALVAQYKKDYDVAYEQWRNSPDAQFSEYKSQEADIVKRVMAMDSFPDGLSRDEYLRRELEKARIAAYQKP